VPPDVTVGFVVVVVGAEEDAVPVFPELDVEREEEVEPEDVEPDVEEVEPDVEDVEPDIGDVEPDVEDAPAAWAPGRSWATTIPMTTVAPVAATTAPCVKVRSRDCALALAAGELCWSGADMWRESSVGDAPIPTWSNRH
jgi:hypothetical protein